MNNSDEHELIPPEPQIVKFIDREFKITPLKVGQLLRIKNLFAGGKLEQLSVNASIIDLIEFLPEEMIKFVEIALEITTEEINKAETIDFVNICSELISQNNDFFVRRLGPSLQKMTAQLLAISAIADGLTHSKHSLTPATTSMK